MDDMHKNHRARLDEKVRKYGIEALAEHEILEFILFAVIPRGDTNGIAHLLIDEFGSINGVFNADVESLKEIDGIGQRAAMFLTAMPQIIGCAHRGILTAGAPPMLDTLEDMGNYACTFFFGKLVECVYAFMLNSQNRLINVRKISEGIETETQIYVSKVVRGAVLDHASGVIIAHNHPGGTLTPSQADISISKTLAWALYNVGINLVDSLVVAGGEYSSIAKMGHISEIIIEEMHDEKERLLRRAQRLKKLEREKWGKE